LSPILKTASWYSPSRSCALRGRDVPRGELGFLGGAGQCGGRGLALLDRLRHRVEVASAHFALMLHCGKAAVGSGKFLFLQLDERAHLAACIAVGEIEHAVVEAVEAGQRDELKLVAH